MDTARTMLNLTLIGTSYGLYEVSFFTPHGTFTMNPIALCSLILHELAITLYETSVFFVLKKNDFFPTKKQKKFFETCFWKQVV